MRGLIMAAQQQARVSAEFIEGNVMTGINQGDRYVESPTGVSNRDAYTIEIWAKLTEKLGITQVLMSERPTSTFSSTSYALTRDVGGDVFRLNYLSENNTSTLLPFGSTINVNQWYHIAIAFDNNNLKINIWLDGELIVNNEDMPFAVKKQDSPIRFFLLGSLNSNPWVGSLSDFRAWNHVRTTAQIQANRCFRLKGNEEGLLRYYKFDEIVNTNVVQDKSINGLDATVTKPDLFSFVNEPKLCS